MYIALCSTVEEEHAQRAGGQSFGLPDLRTCAVVAYLPTNTAQTDGVERFNVIGQSAIAARAVCMLLFVSSLHAHLEPSCDGSVMYSGGL